MLASFFIVNGAKAASKPGAFVAEAEPIVRKVVPLVRQVAPPSVANYVPEETKQLVQLTGAAQVLGGLGLATGLGRRGAASILSASMVPHVLASRPRKGASAEEKTAARSVMLRNVALLGAALIASQDTQGKPSIAWRASHEARALSKEAKAQKRALEKAASKQGKQFKKQTRQLTGGSATKSAAKDVKNQYNEVIDSLESLLK